MQQIPSKNAGCSGTVIVLCAVITAFLAVLAFFGIRQYTDLLGPAKARVAQEQSVEEGEVASGQASNQLPKQPPSESGWSKVQCEPYVVAGSHSNITDTSVLMSVEKFRITNDETVLQLLVEPAHCCKGAYLRRSSKFYIADADGNIYDLIEARNAFDKIFGVSPNGREIRLHEKLRYELVFPKLRYTTPFIYLHSEGFEDIKVKLQWNT